MAPTPTPAPTPTRNPNPRGIADCELNSALGRHDGRVYEALMASAQKAPLNTERTLTLTLTQGYP